MARRQRERQAILVIVLLFLSVFLVACERPLQDDAAAPDTDVLTDADPDIGGGAPGEVVDEIEVEDLDEDDIDADTGEVIDEDEGEPEPITEEDDEAEVVDTEEIVEDEPDDTEDVVDLEEEAEEPEPAEEDEEVVDEEASPRPTAEPEMTPVPVEPEVTEEEGEAQEVEEEAAEEEGEEEAAEEEGEETVAEEDVVEEEEAADAADAEIVHIVQPGDNLYRIGLEYGVSWRAILDHNPEIVNPNRIVVGQAIRIPTGEAPPPPATDTTYVVRPGDTLQRIGRRFNVPWQEIAQANNLINPNRIYVGQVLTIPGAAPDPAPALTHTVQPNETVFRISLHYGVPWRAITTANELRPPYVIYPGDVLIIPNN